MSSPNWREEAQDRSIWLDWIKAAAENENEELEITEQSKKDELKQRTEAVNKKQTQSDWRCSEQGCQFVGRNYAGLVNHTRQSRSTAAQCRCHGDLVPPIIWYPAVSNHQAAYLSLRFGQCVCLCDSDSVCVAIRFGQHIYICGYDSASRGYKNMLEVTKYSFVLSVYFVITLRYRTVSRYILACMIYHHVVSS